MDRKAIFILALSFLLLLLWNPLVDRWFPPVPVPTETAARESTGELSSLTNTEAGTGTNAASLAAATPAADAAAAALAVVPAEAEQQPETTEVLETEFVRYVFTSHGGGIKELELLEYQEVVGRRARRQRGQVPNASLNRGAVLPIFAINGSDALQAKGSYQLSRIGAGLRAEAVLPSGVRIIKEYRPETNYLLKAAVRIENVSTQALRLPPQEWVLGTAGPIDPHDDGQQIEVLWYDGRDDTKIGKPWFANAAFGCGLFGSNDPRSTYAAGSSNVVWASAQNRFFAMIAMPPSNAPAPEVVARKLDLPRPSPEALRADRQLMREPFAIQTAFRYPEVVLAPGQNVERWFDLFAGPKEYRTLDRLGSAYGNEADRVMGFGWFGIFAKGLLLSMNGLHALGLSYGLAIVVITLVIKLLFWPLTQASTRSMKRMQKLQPEMKALQAKYKDDPKKMNERMMAFMKEHRINPAAGCLPILIQIPVFIGFFQMLRSAIELRGAGFLWALDLSQPDTIFEVGGFPVNPLPILMGLSQFWQMRLTPPSPGMDPVQQKIFQFMPLMFLFFLYNFSSGLTLYWTVQNLLTIAQTKLTKSTGEPEKPAAGPKGKPKVKPLPRPGGPSGRPKSP